MIDEEIIRKWDKVFKSGPSKILGRPHPFKFFKGFTWSTLEYFVPNDLVEAHLRPCQTSMMELLAEQLLAVIYFRKNEKCIGV